MGTERKFKAKLDSQGHNGAWTLLRVPFDVENVFGRRGRVSVSGTLNGFPFRSSIFPDGAGKHFMMVNKAMRQGAGVESGDTLSASMTVDTARRTVIVPKDLKTALSHDKAAAAAFKALAYSHQKEFVEWIEGANRPETRAARVAKTLTMATERRRVKG